MDQSYLQRNDASRQRLRDLVAGLDEQDYQRQVNDEWTVAVTLAHLAFWDHSSLARWDEFDRLGSFISLTMDIAELINATSLSTWRALSGPTAAELALEAADLADGRAADLPAAALAYAAANERTFILDRSSHRNGHLDEIDQALAR